MIKYVIILLLCTSCTTIPIADINNVNDKINTIEYQNKIRDAAMLEMIEILKRHEEKLKNYPL